MATWNGHPASNANLISRGRKIHARLHPGSDRYLCRSGEGYGDPVSEGVTDSAVDCKRCKILLVQAERPTHLRDEGDGRYLVLDKAENPLGRVSQRREGWRSYVQDHPWGEPAREMRLVGTFPTRREAVAEIVIQSNPSETIKKEQA